MRDRAGLAAMIALAALSLGAGPVPQLGTTASPDDVAAWDISIPPDGSNLPPGSGSVVQGAIVFATRCQACHGLRGVGGPQDALTGGVGSLASDRPLKTVNSYWPYATTVFDFIRRAMPLPMPESLTDDEVYALVAFILAVDGIVPIDAVLDAETLPQVRMPNRDGFVDWYGKPSP
jgi:cytochrome c